jgi:nucleoside-diphosphate kinase
MIEQTLCILKPDLVAHPNMVAQVLHKLSATLNMVAVRVLSPMAYAQAEELYIEHKGASYYENNIKFMVSDTSIAIVLVGNDATKKLRKLVGATDPEEASEGTLRARYGTTLPRNALHASASAIEAEREIKIFFPEVV